MRIFQLALNNAQADLKRLTGPSSCPGIELTELTLVFGSIKLEITNNKLLVIITIIA